MSLIFMAALAAADPPTAPAAPAAAPAAKAEPAKAAEPKKVCVTEAQLGTYFKKKICATPEQWERRRLQDQAEMSKMGDRTAACTGSSC